MKFFTGNELGVMFLVYLMANRPKAANGAESRHHLQADGRNKRAMCCSRVSTKMPQVIGEIENIVCRRTLTGFKNLASESIELHNGGHDILMAFEESIGYMCDIDLPDKDGMSALNIFIGLVEHSAAGAVGFLQDIHQKYGYFVSKNSYFIIDDEEKRRTILPRLNDHFSAQSKSLAIGPAKVISVEYDAAEKILELRFDHLDAWICVRPSGTEPKVKVYTEAICKPPIGSRHPSSDMPTIAAQTDAFLEATTKAFLDSINLLL